MLNLKNNATGSSARAVPLPTTILGCLTIMVGWLLLKEIAASYSGGRQGPPLEFSAANLLIVGLLMVGFITLAPNGIMGLLKRRRAVP